MAAPGGAGVAGNRSHYLRARAGSNCSRSPAPGEPIRAPVLAANAVMQEEKSVRIVFVLDRAKPGVIFAPERLLPIRLEKVGLPDVGTRRAASICGFRSSPRLPPPRLGAPYPHRVRVRARPDRPAAPCAADGQRESSEDRGIRCRVPDAFDGFGRPAGKTLVEIDLDLGKRGGRRQRFDEAIALIRLKQRRRQPRGLVRVDDLPGLVAIPAPKNVGFGRCGPIVGEDGARNASSISGSQNLRPGAART